ncbi:MAG: hypothetical protein LBS33_02840 [Streptococcaceae bacterium]|jgi:hypothetical protein|nr:hypothetical protein [Streptococcaceae bacterium]
MVPFLIYWAADLFGLAFLLLSIFFTLFYLARKENGNLWAFAFFDVLVTAMLGVIVFTYRANHGFGIAQYSNTYFALIIALLILAILQIVFGRTAKK